MCDKETPPNCYTKSPDALSKECKKCWWVWPCSALYVFRSKGMFAKW